VRRAGLGALLALLIASGVERYGDQAGYVAKVRQAATALERERYLPAEDVTRIVDEALSHR
jgi:hypothetical protein